MSPADKQVIFSLIGVGRVHPPKRQVLKDIYLSFYYGAKIGVLGAYGSGKSTLSGGAQRLVAHCRLLTQEQDILLLEEPTNHLDAESLQWLEQHLQQYEGT